MFSSIFRRLLLVLILFPICGSFFLGCEDDGVSVVDPVISVAPDHLDFGVVELGQESVQPILLTNNDNIPAPIGLLEIADDCGGCFLALNPPGEVPAVATYELSMRFRAVRLESAMGSLSIATTGQEAVVHKITMVGSGTDTRKPDIEVLPPVVEFGFSPAGGVALGSFVVRSTGTNDLLIDRMRIDPADAPFRITTSTPTPQRPGRLAPGAQASVSLRAMLPASATGTVTAIVVIETNVLAEKNVPGKTGWVAVPLRAKANLPPVAVVGADQTVEPWSRVTLDGSQSRDQDEPADLPLVYRWEIVSKPGGSTTVLERASTALPSFWADLTGRYEIRLIVQDALGLESVPVTTVVEALPTNAIRIELTWDHPDSDLDLHLVQDGGGFCDCATDCHYRDCGRTPNWFPQTPGSNPRLDIDDRSGFGPENINIDGHGAARIIAPGVYRIVVHYYSSNAGISTWPSQVSNATVRVYVFGFIAAELTQALMLDGDVWTAGSITWPERLVVPDGTIQSSQICSVF